MDERSDREAVPRGVTPGTPAEPLKTTLNRPPSSLVRDGLPEGLEEGACLLGLHPHEVLGRRYDLTGDGPHRAGRHPSNDLLVPSGDVSRRHCSFQRIAGRWHVVDEGSKNKTYVNDVAVQRAPLRSGDRVTLGGPIFKFFEGTDVEKKIIEQAASLERLDGLTSFLNRKHLHLELDQLLAEQTGGGEPLSLAVFRVDDIDQIIDERVGLDVILREVAAVVAVHVAPGDLIGHPDQSEFVWAMRRTGLDEARARAERLRAAVQEHRFVAGGNRLPVTVSIGVVTHRPHWDLPFLLQQAQSQLFGARQRGNAVQAQVSSEPSHVRGPLEGGWLLRKVLAEEHPRALVAFEVDDEAALLEVIGAQAHRQWTFELQQVANEKLPPEEYLGHWQHRYVLATLRADDPDLITQLAASIDGAFAALGTAPGSAVLRRSRHAYLRSEEVAAFGERALDEVIRKLLTRSGTAKPASQTIQRLPHPLAVPHAVIATRTPGLRARSVADGIDQYLRFLVAIELGWLRLRVGHDAVPGVIDVLDRVDPTKKLSFGSWLLVARHLARLVPRGARGLVPSVVEPLAAERGAGASLQRRLQEAVSVRNNLVHRPQADELAYGPEEKFLSEVFHELTRLVGALHRTRLISVKGVEDVGGDVDEDQRTITYTVREHRGPPEIFATSRLSSESPLAKGWCYLLADEERPIPLAPLYWSGPCTECRREEVFVAEGLWQGTLRQSEIELVGVTTTHKVKVHAPIRAWEKQVIDGWMGLAKRGLMEPPSSRGPGGRDEAMEGDSEPFRRVETTGPHTRIEGAADE